MKILFQLLLLGLSFALCGSAFAQLTLVQTVNNSTWAQTYDVTNGTVLYDYPGALCSSKLNSDQAPSDLFSAIPTVFVLDATAKNLVFSAWDPNAGAYGYFRFGSNFKAPRGIVSFSNGDVYVADTFNNRIVKLNVTGNSTTYVNSITSPVSAGAPSQFNYPFEMTEDSNGDIYVADSGNNQIEKFDRNLNPINTFVDQRGPEAGTNPVNFIGGVMGHGQGQFMAPQGVAVNLTTGTSTSGNIYVADLGNERIQEFNSSGNYITEYDLATSGASGIGPNPLLTYLEVDENGLVYAVDQRNNLIYVFDGNLNFLFPFAGDPSMPFSDLQGVAVEKSQDAFGNFYSHGNIYVTDAGNLETFSVDFSITNLNLTSPIYSNTSLNCSTPSTITYSIDANSEISVQVFASGDTPLRTIVTNDPESTGNIQQIWDGKINGPNGLVAAPAGVYTILVSGSSSTGSGAYAADGVTVISDTTPPAISVAFNGPQYLDITPTPNELFVKKGDTFNITATDTQSGVNITSFGLDTSTLTTGTSGTVPLNWADGLHNLYVQSTDNVCNTASVTQQIFIDTTPPLNHVAITGNGCSNDGQIPDTATAISSEGQNIVAFVPVNPGVYPSGVSIGEYSINGGPYQVDNGTNFQNATSQIGTYEVNLYSVDNMGNQSAVRHISDIRLPVLPAIVATSGQVDFLNSSVTVDSYNSSNPYGPSNSFSNGNVQAEGAIVENGNPVIKGTLCQDCSINYPLIAVPQDAVTLGTELINGPTTLTAGDYVASSFTVNGGASLVGIGGQVRIWVTGTISIDSSVTAYNNHPDNLWFIGGANTNVNINGGTTIIGIIYTPDSQINVNYTVFGSVVGSQVNVNGGGAVHRDDYSSCGGANGTTTPTFTPTYTPTAIATICPYTFTTQWSGSAAENIQFSDPEGAAVDQNGNVYVADTDNNMVEKFDSRGNYLTAWSGGVTAFDNPEGIATDSIGNVYVADTENNIIQVFKSNGTFVRQFGGSGLGSGTFNSPVGLAVYASGPVTYVYVADIGNGLVQQLDSTGHFYNQISGANGVSFSNPEGVAVDGSGNVFVADTLNNLIWKFTTSGNFEMNWGGVGIGNGMFDYPEAVAVDASGNVYVADTNNNRVQIFNNLGNYAGQFGGFGPGNGLFNLPSGVAIDPFGNLFVADTDNNLIQKFNNCSTTSTPTPQPTNIPTNTSTNTPTNSPTNTPSNSPTASPTATPTSSPTLTSTPTASPTATSTNTPTITFTYTVTPLITWTYTPTNSPSSTPTQTPTYTPTNTPVPANCNNYSGPLLNLEVENNNDPCTSNQNYFNYQIYNWGTSAVTLANMKIVLYVNTGSYAVDLNGAYDTYFFSKTGTQEGSYNGTLAYHSLGTTITCGGKVYNGVVTLSFSAGSQATIDANGGYVGSGPGNSTQMYLNGWPSANFDATCNAYSDYASGGFRNDLGYVLLYNGSLVQEVTSGSGSVDPSTGQIPCTVVYCTPTPTSGAHGNVVSGLSFFIGGDEKTATATPTLTPTATITPTSTTTITSTPTASGLLQLAVAAPNVSKNGQPINFMINLGSNASVQLNLYSLMGEEVYSDTIYGNAGSNTITWLLRNKTQATVASGIYIFTIQVNNGSETVMKTGKVLVFHK